MNIEEKITELIMTLTMNAGTAAIEYEQYKTILHDHAVWSRGRAAGLSEAVDMLNEWLNEIELSTTAPTRHAPRRRVNGSYAARYARRAMRPRWEQDYIAHENYEAHFRRLWFPKPHDASEIRREFPTADAPATSEADHA
jgi:hypothetical protein